MHLDDNENKIYKDGQQQVSVLFRAGGISADVAKKIYSALVLLHLLGIKSAYDEDMEDTMYLMSIFRDIYSSRD